MQYVCLAWHRQKPRGTFYGVDSYLLTNQRQMTARHKATNCHQSSPTDVSSFVIPHALITNTKKRSNTCPVLCSLAQHF
ncbi:hypothetical protein LSH36_674g01051 [Paralvinella palmiformis]|uniref:Uncharacterized protein n=1 Tax=Paralvinella palmiformis TaxID=53620 RepID=A0AAD9J398_9ANNE|nr:hypothetical protein LSH36_674g01051 [Paralvinella palmiformis]